MISIILRSKKLANEECPIILKITKDGKTKIITLGISCLKEHWNGYEISKKHKNSAVLNRIILKQKSKALKIIDDFRLEETDFTLEDFESIFRGEKRNKVVNVISFFDEIIDEMNRAGRIGNAEAYKSTRNSIIKFKGKNLNFRDITPAFLEKYEVFLRENGNKNGGIVFKMKELKALLNKARKRKIIPKEPYPFEDYQISKLKSSVSKRALSIEDFKKIRDVNLTNHPHLIDSHYYFLFSVYTRGMNFKDMLHLKWSDIQYNRIHYTRSKTNGVFNLEIIEKAQCILDYYKAQNRPTEYVFPILLYENLTPLQLHYRKQKVLRRYNFRLKEIAELSGVQMRLTTYVARHSFATILKMSGTPIEKISEMMGHADVSITMSYLKEFSNEDLDIENRKFMDL